MKTNKFLDALNAEIPAMHLHEQRLKLALLKNGDRKPSAFYRFQSTFANAGDTLMGQHKKFISFGTLAVVGVMTLSFVTYSYKFSPKAEADQLVRKGIGFVRTIDSGQMGKIQSQLGGDPVEALKEAKEAKDLEVITKDEFNAEAKKHKGVAMSSLGNDGPQYGSVGIGVNGDIPPTTPPTDAVTHYSTGGPMGTQEGGVSTGTVSSDGSNPQKVLQFHAEESGTSANNPGSPASPPPTPIQPSKYLRYTDKTGHVVVLGLDDHGIPVNKTIFMNNEDIQNMPQPKFDLKQ